MLVAMAGLPGTGKSTLAARLARELGAVVLNKDEVRAALFPPPVLNYSREQDDIAMAAIYRAAASIHQTFPGQAILIDGRTFLSSYQVRDLLALGSSLGETPRFIECICDEEIAWQRLEQDLARGGHPAGNRTLPCTWREKLPPSRCRFPTWSSTRARRRRKSASAGPSLTWEISERAPPARFSSHGLCAMVPSLDPFADW